MKPDLPDPALTVSVRNPFNADISRLAIVRGIWLAVALLCVVLIVASIPGYVFVATQGHYPDHVVELPAWLLSLLDIIGAATSFVAAAACLGLAGLLFIRRSDDPMALYSSFYLLMFGIVMAGPLERLEWILPGASLLATRYLQPLSALPTIILLALFPSGHFVPRWTRWLLAPTLILSVLGVWGPPGMWISPGWPADGAWLAIGIAGVYAQVFRYRNVSGPIERQQTKWAVFGFVLWVVWSFLISIPYTMVLNLPANAPLPWWVPILAFGWWISLLITPVSLTIAVLRYRLWEIDLIINRALVYSALSGLVIGIYLLVVGLIGSLLHARDNLFLSMLGVGLVALVVQPVRERFQRWVNRLMYGDREEPYIVLSRLGSRLETTLAPDAVLVAMVETLAQSLKLPYAAITASTDGDSNVLAEHGQPVSTPESFPLVFQAETIGHLMVGTRSPGEVFTASEIRLLENIAYQAGSAVHAVRLKADLQHSRTRLVRAREEERRRLRRDLHDGLGPILASQGLKLAAARELLSSNVSAVETLLDQMIAQNESSVAEIRRVVYALRPPALDERGLVEAVRDHVVGLNGTISGSPHLHIEIRSVPANLPPLPAAIEVAAYRIALEALTNVVHHAQAQRCTIRFELQTSRQRSALRVDVLDDGVGLPDSPKTGVGLRSMRERVEELGGTLDIESAHPNGAHVTAILPFSEEP